MKVTVRVVNLHRLKPLGQIVAFLLLLSVPWLAAAQTNGFDVPLKKRVVWMSVSPSTVPKGRAKLSCYFYPTFMVKEYDGGQKGAEWLSIVPIEKETAPTCTQSHASGERVIQYPEWRGYFKGAKGNLVFFVAADEMGDCHLPFTIPIPRRRFLRIRLMTPACGTRKSRIRLSIGHGSAGLEMDKSL
jgi:hypothetical protein